MAEYTGFTSREIPELPSEPYSPTIVTLDGVEYEYARRYVTLEPPSDVGSLATGKLAIVGIHNEPNPYNAINISPEIISPISEYISVNSNPIISTELTNLFHFKTNPIAGIASTSLEFGFYFDKESVVSGYRFGFYCGDENPGITTLPSHKKWATFMETNTVSEEYEESWNFFEDLVLVGDHESVESLDEFRPEPLVQILRPLRAGHTKRGLYVEDTAGIGTFPDKRIQLYVDTTDNLDATHAIKTIGNVDIQGTLSKTSGTFDIEHPIDESKRLRHSFVEAPRYDNIYRNKVRLINGKAKVNLDFDCVSPGGQTMTPGTWEKLNRNPDIFLQNLEGWDRLRGKIDGSILTIECENSNSTDLISWMVVSERKDKFIINSNISDDEGRLILEY